MTTRRQKKLKKNFRRAEVGDSSTRRDVTCCQGQIAWYKGDTSRHEPQKGRAISIYIARSVPPSHRLTQWVGDPEGRDADEALIWVLCSGGRGASSNRTLKLIAKMRGGSTHVASLEGTPTIVPSDEGHFGDSLAQR